MPPEPLRVDPERLASSARQLLAHANQIPSPPAPQAVTGGDALSQAIAAQTGKVETPITEGLPAAQKSAVAYGENMASASRRYDQSDHELADRIRRMTFPDKAQEAGFGIKPDAPPIDKLSRPGDMKSGDINTIDQANRKLLAEMLQEYSQLPAGQVRTDRLADIAGIQNALKIPDSHLLYVAKPDDPSQMIRAATSIGDPFKSDHVSVTVPGVSSSTRQSFATMTQEAYGLRQEAQFIAAHTPGEEGQKVSTIAWMGYQPPPVLDSWDTATDRLARAGAPNLQSFLSDLHAGAQVPGHTTALFGHSYGSLLSGIALKDGASSMVDDVVLYGSPGFEATSPAQLGMSDKHFFVMSAPDDPIRLIGGLAPLHGWGADPNAIIYGDPDRYRFTHLETQAGTVNVGGDELNKTGASGHSEYGRDPLRRMTGYNLATILLNRPDLAVQENLPPQ